MEISGEYIFETPRDLVWKALLDPNVLGSVMPGGQAFQQIGENKFTGVLLIKVGPVQGTFQGQIQLSDVKPPESYQIEVDGKGAPGFVKATGSLHLEARDGQTYMQYSGQAHIGGRIASVGQRLLDTSARSIIRQSLEGLNEYLKVRAAQQAAVGMAATAPAASAPATAQAPMPAGAVPAYKPPSQTQVALNVARDVFNDLIPAQWRPVVIGAGIVVLVLLIWLIVRR